MRTEITRDVLNSTTKSLSERRKRLKTTGVRLFPNKSPIAKIDVFSEAIDMLDRQYKKCKRHWIVQ